MGLEEQNNESGQASGGNGASQTPNKQAATVLGTATRQPVFGQQQGQESSGQTGGQDGVGSSTQTAPVKGRQTVTLPPGALDDRLNRAKASAVAPWLKELGAKDEAEAKQKLAELKKAGEEREKQRLAEMSEIERYKTELQTAQARIAELEAMIAQHEEAKEHEQHEQVIGRVAGEVLAPKALRLFKLDLAQHVKKLHASNPELAEKFGERGIRRFADKWLKENPEFAKPSDTTQTTTADKPTTSAAKPAPTQTAPVRRPVTTGAPQRRPAPPQVQAGDGLVNGKTLRPGQPNSMSSQEVAAHVKRTMGINYRPM